MKVVLCFSGGIDSTVLLARLRSQGDEVTCFGLDYGQRHLRELLAARDIASRMGVEFETVALRGHMFDGSMLTQNGESVVVPNRNAVLISLATAIALRDQADAVAIACHEGDHALWPDCRPGFLHAMFEVLMRCDHKPVRLLYPFVRMNKLDIIRLGIQLGVEFDATWSCYMGGDEPCGDCPACLSRREALFLAGVTPCTA